MTFMSNHQTGAPKSWDEDFYLKQNPDVKLAVDAGLFANGHAHFLQFGTSENRLFRFRSAATAPLDWSDLDYLQANPELKPSGYSESESNAFFDHWNRVGRFEGRKRVRDQIINRAQETTSLPASIIQEMYMQSQYEPSMFPNSYFDDRVQVTSLDWMAYKGKVLRAFINELGRSATRPKAHISQNQSAYTAYAELAQTEFYTHDSCELHFTHIFFAPWLKTGGADKAALLFANSIAEQQNTNVLFITTEMTDSPWAKRLHPNITYFDAGNYFGKPGAIPVSLSMMEQRELIAAFLLDHPPAKLHVINSHLGWFLLGKYGRALSQKTDLYVSLYCYDFTHEFEPVGYARYIRLVAPFVKGIISDNTKFPDELSKNFGIPRKKFTTTWHPVALAKNIRPFTVDPKCSDVLWASRLDRQKRPDLLLQVARLCPELNFHVYGDSVMNDASAGEFLRSIQKYHNIYYHGAYDSLNEIKRIPYRAFLYTSQWDGLPNILLEFGLLGLPLVSPDVGGIGDLLNDATGYTVRTCEDVPGYARALHMIAAQPDIALARATMLKSVITKRHDNSEFLATLASMGYLDNWKGDAPQLA